MIFGVFLFLLLGLLGAQGQYYSDLEAMPDDPFQIHSWNWRTRIGPSFWSELRREEPEREIDELTKKEKDREPLAPDYKDPIPGASEDKPVVQPKPTTTQKPSFNPSVIPGGVIDVDANVGSDFSSGFSSPGFSDFGFSSSFGGRPGLFGLGGFFGSLGQIKPWWKGPNVCIERQETTDDDDDESISDDAKNDTETVSTPNMFSTAISLSNCQQMPSKYECVTKINNHGVVKTFTVTYKCCYGYQRVPNTVGCTKQVDLKPLMDTIEEVGGKEFKNIIKSTGLEETLNGKNYTVFVPTDAALNEFTEKMLELNKVELMTDAVKRKRREIKNAVSSKDLILSHVTPGFVDLSELSNEELIFSENNNSSIRINFYPTHNNDKLVTANCARITKPNNLAKNGITHVIEGVVVPAMQSIQEIISENKKLSNLKQVLENTDLMKTFKDDGYYTIFAPSDEAFNKLDESTKQKLLRGNACASSTIKHHIVAHTICSSAIIGNATTHNIEGELLNMERTIDDQLILEEKAKIVETDIIATNGVIHLIDTILIPDSALHINQALKNQNLTKFQSLIEEAGLVEEIDSLANATVFAPSDKAFEDEAVTKHIDEIKGDKNKLKEMIMYHTVQGQMQSCDMNNNEILKSNDNEKPLRINLYSTLPLFTNIVNRATVNCARLTGFDEKTCGSVIHEVSKVLIPPANNIMEILNGNEKYSTLRKIMKDTEIENMLSETNHSITLLAPTDEAFASLPEEDLKVLMENKDKATEVLKNHILTEVLCCSGVGPQTWGFNSLVPTLANGHHQIGRTGRHQIRIGSATVTSCDNLATNGVLHSINRVLMPQRHQTPNFGLFLFDF